MSDLPDKPGGGRQRDHPRYEYIEVPTDTPPIEYTYTQRRADLLNRIERCGSPYNLPSQEELGREYGVHKTTICKDMKRLREYIGVTLGDECVFEVQSMYRKTVTELHREGQWKKAWDVVMDFYRWLADAGYASRQQPHMEGMDEALFADGQTFETDDYTLTVTSEMVDPNHPDEHGSPESR